MNHTIPRDITSNTNPNLSNIMTPNLSNIMTPNISNIMNPISQTSRIKGIKMAP
jgi:hypothetical protein